MDNNVKKPSILEEIRQVNEKLNKTNNKDDAKKLMKRASELLVEYEKERGNNERPIN